jgi:hypothetical protein
MDRTPRHWIAINGSTCALSPGPLRPPLGVSPTPEVLVGFLAEQDARTAQSICLTAAPADVKESMREWLSRADVEVIRPPNPEPQTDGPTAWVEG